MSRRRWAWVGVVLAVLIAHAWLGDRLHAAMLGWGAANKPQVVRMEVAFVKALAPAAPPAVSPVAVATAKPPPARRPRAPREAAPPVELPASAPEPAASTPPPVEASASAFDPLTAQAASAPAPQELAASTAAPQPAALAAASAPIDNRSAAASAQPFDWPPSTRLTYSLVGNYRGEVHGSARVQWVRRGERYQVHLDVFVGPSFAPLMSRRMTSEGSLSDAGLAPQRYEEQTKLPFQAPRQLTMGFEPGRVALPNGQFRTAPPAVQDTASQFVHLAWLFTLRPDELRVGNAIAVPLALPRRVDTWVYEVVAQEPLYTPAGVLDTFHLKPRRMDARPKGELSAEIWFAPNLQYLPVRIRIQQDAETYVDLMLDAAPLQAEPDSGR
jgi:Protein of unknown function (DUF3108)